MAERKRARKRRERTWLVLLLSDGGRLIGDSSGMFIIPYIHCRFSVIKVFIGIDPKRSVKGTVRRERSLSSEPPSCRICCCTSARAARRNKQQRGPEGQGSGGHEVGGPDTEEGEGTNGIVRVLNCFVFLVLATGERGSRWLTSTQSE